MNANALLNKAERAAESAKLLLANGDFDSACNCAYYAMFDAARAALLSKDPTIPSDAARSHNGLISVFSLQLVKTGLVPVAFGKDLNKAEDLRLIADYKGEPVDQEQAIWVVKQSSVFVSAMLNLCSGEKLK